MNFDIFFIVLYMQLWSSALLVGYAYNSSFIYKFMACLYSLHLMFTFQCIILYKITYIACLYGFPSSWCTCKVASYNPDLACKNFIHLQVDEEADPTYFDTYFEKQIDLR